MNWGSWLLWGFASTVVLTSILAGSQGLGMTRMNIPYLLGTMITPNRDRAKFIGFFLHFANGWIFSLIYVAAFQVFHTASWWLGAGIGRSEEHTSELQSRPHIVCRLLLGQKR